MPYKSVTGSKLGIINPRREKVAGNLRSGMYVRRFQCLLVT